MTDPRTRVASGTAYDVIRGMIEAGELGPGARLREEALSERIGVSRTPVREAIRELTAEGLVEAVPHQGARVTSWTPEDVDELYRLRAQLEGYGARQAARNGSAAAAEALWGKAQDYERESAAAQGGDLSRAVECNVAFHEAVLALAGSPRLGQLVRGVRSALLVQRALGAYEEDDRVRSVVHHRDIVRAVERRDEELAELAMRTHILAARYPAMRAGGVVPRDPA